MTARRALILSHRAYVARQPDWMLSTLLTKARAASVPSLGVLVDVWPDLWLDAVLAVAITRAAMRVRS